MASYAPVDLLKSIPAETDDAAIDASVELTKRRHVELENRGVRLVALREAITARLAAVSSQHEEQLHFNRANLGALILEKESRKRKLGQP